MEPGSVNLIMTSPPYAEARNKTYGGIPPDEYVEWFKPIAKEIYKVLADNGSFILNIGDNTINGETHLYTFELPIMLKREIGFKFIDPFIWHKKTAPPGKYMNRFKDSWEFCYHFAKQINIKFRPQSVAKPAKQVSIERAMRHKDSHKLISNTGSGFTNASKNLQKKIRQNESAFKTNDQELSELALPGNVLYLSGETTNVGHSAPFPLGIPEFFIKAFTDEKDLVYDPFMGSGTTAVVCIQWNRNYVGSEINREYCQIAERRLQPYKAQINMFHKTKGE
jgi:DNA modification methylase